MPSGRQTTHLSPVGWTWTPPNSWDGYRWGQGFVCCTAAVLNLGKAFSPAAKHRQENLTQIHHLPNPQQDPSCSEPGHSCYTLYPSVEQDVFNSFKKSLAKKLTNLFEWNVLSLYVALCLPSDSCWFSFGGKAASKTAETIWCKRQAQQ